MLGCPECPGCPLPFPPLFSSYFLPLFALYEEQSTAVDRVDKAI